MDDFIKQMFYKKYLTVFAIGESYASLFFARAIQGIGSACLNVCGMSLIAHVSILIFFFFI